MLLPTIRVLDGIAEAVVETPTMEAILTGVVAGDHAGITYAGIMERQLVQSVS